MGIPTEIGAEISRLRDKLGMSQPSFAQLVGVSPVTISRWENGFSVPSDLAMQKIRSLSPGTVTDLEVPEQINSDFLVDVINRMKRGESMAPNVILHCLQWALDREKKHQRDLGRIAVSVQTALQNTQQ